MNRTKFDTLRSILLNYKAEVNAIGKTYTAQLERYRQAYSTEYFQAKSQELKAAEKFKFDALRNTAKNKIRSIIEEIRNDLDVVVSNTDNLETLQTLATIKSMGTKLSYSELNSYLRKSNGSYAVNKILSDLAKESGFVIDFHGLEEYEKALKQVENGVNTLLNCYSGENMELKDWLGDNIVNGISYGSYQPYTLALADAVLKPGSSLDQATSLWEINSQLTIKQRDQLTAEEKVHIESLYEDHKGAIADRTKELLSINPALKEQLLLHERYSEFVPVE
jgi:hypothetical protein